MKDRHLIEKLLSLGSELVIQGNNEGAAVCTFAAARLMELPGELTLMRHPSAKVADAITDKGNIVTLRGEI